MCGVAFISFARYIALTKYFYSFLDIFENSILLEINFHQVSASFPEIDF